MSDCRYCRHAVWDCDFYGEHMLEWCITGCVKGLDDPEGEDCDEYEDGTDIEAVQ